MDDNTFESDIKEENDLDGIYKKNSIIIPSLKLTNNVKCI